MSIYDLYRSDRVSKEFVIDTLEGRDTELLEMKQVRSEDFQFLCYIYNCIKNGTTVGLDEEIKEYLEDHKL